MPSKCVGCQLGLVPAHLRCTRSPCFRRSQVLGYLYNGYWEDIGTIRAFFDANLALVQDVSGRCFEWKQFVEACSVAARHL